MHRPNISMRNKGGLSIGSNLSIREVERIKKWVINKDREERKRNIIIRGLRIPREVINDKKKCVERIC